MSIRENKKEIKITTKRLQFLKIRKLKDKNQ